MCAVQCLSRRQAAKKAFDDLGLKKLPTVKELQAEYASLLTEKKSSYAKYRVARDRMKELLAVKANVDRLMGYDRAGPEKNTGIQEEHETSFGENLRA